ncbi:MAG: alpha/beta hydrolase family protein [Bacilli bacterium]
MPEWLSAPPLLAVRTHPSEDPEIAVYHLTYRADGFRQTAYLAYRRDAVKNAVAPLPGFLYLRGGVGRVGMVKQDWLLRFARRGAVVLAPVYRGNEGGEGREDFGLRDRADAFAGVTLLQNLAVVDADRVSVYGFSRGGPMALFCAMEDLNVHTAITHGGVADLALTYEQRVDLRRLLKRITGGSPTKMPDAYRERSPVWRASDIRAPLLIIHGAADVQVDVSHAQRLASACTAANVNAELWILPETGHHLPSAQWDFLIDRMFSWIREK